jgi:hypothetical protein
MAFVLWSNVRLVFVLELIASMLTKLNARPSKMVYLLSAEGFVDVVQHVFTKSVINNLFLNKFETLFKTYL